MEKTYNLNGFYLHVNFEPQLIRINTAAELNKYLTEDIDLRTTVLANIIKNDYLLFFDKPLRISSKSIVIEIWGHAFAGYVARLIERKLPINLVRKLAKFVLNRSDRIDCGERTVDTNRIVWDLLASFKPLILCFLPRKMK